MKVGLIAHDEKKRLMQDLCVAYKPILRRHELFATETTGRLVEEATGLRVHKFLSPVGRGAHRTGFKSPPSVFVRPPL